MYGFQAGSSFCDREAEASSYEANVQMYESAKLRGGEKKEIQKTERRLILQEAGYFTIDWEQTPTNECMADSLGK